MSPESQRGFRISLKWAHSAFLEDLPLKAVALLLALLFWGSVQLVQDSRETLQLSMVVDPPVGHVVVGEAYPTVHVTVAGPLNDIENYRNMVADSPIHLKAQEYGLGRTSVYLNPDLLGLPNSLRTEAIRPSMITLFLDREITRVVAVKPELQGSPSPGLTVTGVQATPSRVSVRGPATEVEALPHVIAGPIDLDGAVNSMSVTAAVRTDRRGVALVDLAEVQVAVEINAPLMERVFEDLQVEANAQYRALGPINLRLKGPRDSLSRLAPKELRLQLEAVQPRRDSAGRLHLRVLVEGLPQGVVRLGPIPEIKVGPVPRSSGETP